MAKGNIQRFYWSVSRPIKYLGLTIDEWVVAIGSILPGLLFINSGSIIIGILIVISGIFLCWSFKKYKRMATSFNIKSYLIAKGAIKAPRRRPKLFNKNRVGQ